MQNKKNSGFSMVEILIGLAIFIILMMPIVSAIIGAMNNTTKGKDLQYRNEYVESLMEHAKEATVEKIIAGEHVVSSGSFDAQLPDLTMPNGDYEADCYFKGVESSIDGTKTAEYEKYLVKGSVNLGTTHKKYSYIMEISNQEYAKKEVEGTFVNPNNLKLGVVEDLDYTKLALINGTIANYDKAVANTFLAKKIEYLRDFSPVKYEQYISSEKQVDIFSEDTANRIITVKVEGKKDTGYKVSCILSYHDNSTVSLDGGKNMSQYLKDDIEYIPYTAEFKELPDIYLMYNVCMYNNAYSPNDYIVFDTAGVKDETEVNVFVVETAEKYSSTIAEVVDENALGDKDKSLIYSGKITHGTTNRNDVNIYMGATNGSKLYKEEDGVRTPLLNVYHNFGFVPDEEIPKGDGTVEMVPAKNQKNDKIHYLNFGSNTYLGAGTYKTLDGANVAALNQATQEERGLYNISIWMAEGDIEDVDMSKQPLMTGTKGGK